MANKAQLIVSSSQTYFNNTAGNITPDSVNTFNTNWINSSVLNDNTGSLLVTASFSGSTLTFTKGDNTTFGVVIPDVSGSTIPSGTISGSQQISALGYVQASVTASSLVTASVNLNQITFTKGDGSTFNVTIVSSSYAYTASSAVNATNALTASFLSGNVASASLAQNSLLLQGTGSNGFATTASLTAVSSSGQQVSASYIALSGSYNIFSGSASTRLTNTSQSLQAVSASDQQLSASYIALSASYNVFSGSASARITAVSSSDQQTSASYIALSGSYNIFSGSASTRITSLESFSSSLDATFATDAQLNSATQSLSASTSTVNTRVTEVSSSLQAVSSSTQQVSASYIALSASYNTFSGSASTRLTNDSASIAALNTASGSFAVLSANQTFSGKNTFNNDVTASNIRITGTASVAFLDVTFQSSSVIYSSGSNQFGDASNDTQTLYGTVNVITGPLVVTGSANFASTITGSISGNAGTATSSTSASYAFTASSAISASFASVAASVLGAITSASYAYTASSAVNAATSISASYAYTASSAISANTSLFGASGSSILIDNFNGINSTYYLTMVENATGYKRVGLDTDISYNPSTNILSATVQSAATASSITIDNYNGVNSQFFIAMVENATGAKRVGLDTDLAYNPSTNLLTGLITSASFATSASRAISALSSSYAENAGTASVFLGSVVSASYAYTASSAVNAASSISASYAYTASSAENATSASFALSASFLIGGGSSAITIADEGASQGTATFLDFIGAGVTATVSSNTASINIAGGGSAFPFTGSAVITGSLTVTGSSLFSGPISGSNLTLTNSGSILLFSSAANNRGIQNMLISDSGSRNNIISITQVSTTQTGSFVVSGSGNLINITDISNSSVNQGAVFGVNATQAIITAMPLLTGSNATKILPTISTSAINAQITITDNRTETNRSVNVSNSNINSNITANIASGSISIQNSGINGQSLTVIISGSGTSANNAFIQNSTICATTTNIVYAPTSSGQSQLAASLIVGSNNRLLMTGSSSGGGTAVSNPSIGDAMILGKNLIVTGSSQTTSIAPIALVGSYNLANGLLNDGKFTRFAVGTGAAEATRRTSFHVSASGMVTCFDGLTVSGSQVITGSLYGSPVSQSVSSLTASLNLQAGNFFNLTLPASANTFITASGQLPGQTVNIKVTQGATTGSLSFGAGFKQVSGSFYTGSSTANAVDIVTLISFDSTGLYVSNVNNLI